MIVIPAIDIKDGKCVRLRQGRMESFTIFNDEPAAQAKQWEEQGATRIHVVDLDGSFAGRPANLERVRNIVRGVKVPVQVGGGIRNEATIRAYLEIGVQCVILGTAAARDPEAVIGFLNLFPGRVAIGIDAKNGIVAVDGWTQSSHMTATDVAARFDAFRPAAFIYTDIERDGMMRGPNANATREFAGNTSTPVILSGGVSRMDDLHAVLPLEKDGIMGIIIGRALYEGSIQLSEAIKLIEKRNAC